MSFSLVHGAKTNGTVIIVAVLRSSWIQDNVTIQNDPQRLMVEIPAEP